MSEQHDSQPNSSYYRSGTDWTARFRDGTDWTVRFLFSPQDLQPLMHTEATQDWIEGHENFRIPDMAHPKISRDWRHNDAKTNQDFSGVSLVWVESSAAVDRESALLHSCLLIRDLLSRNGRTELDYSLVQLKLVDDFDRFLDRSPEMIDVTAECRSAEASFNDFLNGPIPPKLS